MENNMKILTTGGTGFLGRALVRHLDLFTDYSVVLAARGKSKAFPRRLVQYAVGDISQETCWSNGLSGVHIVIHCAAIAHIAPDNCKDSQLRYRETNTLGTLKLARQAVESGVERFIYISSIGVNGLSSSEPFRHNDLPNPLEPYAVSKYEAEVGLKKIAKETDMEVVIIRPPLVYGASAPGNFGKLISLAKRNLPLPLGAINNKRSLVGIDNLIDLIVTCLIHPNAADQTFLVSDDYDVSTSQLLKAMILSTGKKPHLLPIPVGLLKLCAWLLGKKSAVVRMSGNLQIDISYTKKVLSWSPPVSFDEGIRRCF
jgi:nucleoside-diphosphate-sugar epimerase